jgi:superfamily II DNA or RNA helicase
MYIKLYPHNQETYNKIQEVWENTNRVAVIQPTGSGKSFIILKCLLDLREENKVVLSPSHYIFGQLTEHYGKEIPNVKFITYAKIANMSEEEIRGIRPSLIILDEFHRCGAEQWGEGVQRLIDTYPEVKLLGTSATPIRYLDNGRNMADELFDGNVATNMSLPEAIVKEILPMPKYVSALYTMDEEIINLKEKVENSQNDEEDKKEILKQITEMKNKLEKSKGIPVILKKYLDVNSGKFIVFCKNKEHLNEMKQIVVGWFKKAKISNKIETYTIYSDYANGESEFNEFKNNRNKNSIKLLFTIDMLNEGIHVDDITGVILLRPTSSPIIYYQQMGRAIDAGNREQPLIFDFVNNFNNVGVRGFLTNLRELTEKRKKESEKRYCGDTEEEVIKEFTIYDETLEIQELFSQLEDRLIDNWDIMYEKLKEYYEEHGDCNINAEQSGKLGRWVKTQRKVYSSGLMLNDRVEKLNSINFVWDVLKTCWNSMYDKLMSYYKIHGNIDIPQLYKMPDGSKLGYWLDTQRRNYRENILAKEKILKLSQIGFVGSPSDCHWNEQFNKLRTYYEQHKSYLDLGSDASFLIWVSRQRTLFKNNLLTDDRVAKLESINFIWDAKDINWRSNINMLKQHGVNISCTFITEEGCKLGAWVTHLRKSYKKGKLSQDRIDELNNLGFIWLPNINFNRKRIICLNTKDIFGSIKQASIWCNLSSYGSITQYLSGKLKSAGKHPETGEPLQWMYLEDYEKMTNKK